MNRTLALFARNLSVWRQRKDLSQKELATRAGISVAFLSTVERGKNCSVEKAAQIATALEVPLYVLMLPDSNMHGHAARDNIIFYRKQTSLPIRALARLSKVPLETITAVENGEESLSYCDAKKIAAVFDILPADLFEPLLDKG